jgi:hypothetical protein
VRCGNFLVAPEDRPSTEEERDDVELRFFGEAGCVAATLADFRDARALREECVPALRQLSCDASFFPEPCQDQIRATP